MDKQIKCIIVEDYEPLNNIYANLLDYEKDIAVVGRAFDSTGLFEILEKGSADVVLLDIEMKSRTEGLDTCKRISMDYPDIKVVILTCHDEDDMILSAFEAGAVDYVLKTSSSSHILEAVRSAFSNTSAINPRVAYVIRKRVKEFGSMKESLLFVMNIISGLTASELDVLKLSLQGRKKAEIAEIRKVELVTVKAHVSSILRKFDKGRMTEVLQMVKDTGLQSFVENMKV